jgi:hypothetical protein
MKNIKQNKYKHFGSKLLLMVTIFVLVYNLFSCSKIDEEEHYSLYLKYNINENEQVSFKGNEGGELSSDTKNIQFFSAGLVRSYDQTNQILKMSLFTQFFFDTDKLNIYTITYNYDENFHKIDTTNAKIKYKIFEDLKNVFLKDSLSFFSSVNNIEGITFNIQEDNDIVWTSFDFINSNSISVHGNFANSYFRIKDVERMYSFGSKSDGVRVFADFQVTLYNEHNDSIVLKNGNCALFFVEGW